ncbi:Hypothetical protein FKW44_002652, partial [Caligus rogercresseyi]
MIILIFINVILERAGLPSLNEVAAKAVALGTWKCFNFNDGGVTSSSPSEEAHETATFACHAISVWNIFKALRSATTLPAARTAARAMGRS